MKRVIPLLLTLALALSACGGKEAQVPAKTPEELSAAYTEAITAARDAELNEYLPVVTNTTAAEPTELEMTFALLGIAPEDVSAYAVSLSLMNVNAYAVAALMPAEGKEDAVQKGLEGYIDNQKQSFEHYLEDQFDIASNAKLEKLKDGTLLLVMCDGQDGVFDSIKGQLEK